MNPRILIYDIESFPNISYTWGKWDQNVIAFKQERMMCSVAWKWLGEKKVHCAILPDYSGYKKDRFDNTALVKEFHAELEKADMTVAHNGVKFDEKMINTDFILRGLKPPAPHKVVDTLKLARHKFAFNSNSLNDLGKRLKLGKKFPHPGFPMWLGCMEGDMKQWNLMKKYNIQDVKLLEKVYLKLRPWSNKTPNLNHYLNKGCPTCGSYDVIKRGLIHLVSGKRQRFQCNKCGSWCSLHITHKGNKQMFKNA